MKKILIFLFFFTLTAEISNAQKIFRAFNRISTVYEVGSFLYDLIVDDNNYYSCGAGGFMITTNSRYSLDVSIGCSTWENAVSSQAPFCVTLQPGTYKVGVKYNGRWYEQCVTVRCGSNQNLKFYF